MHGVSYNCTTNFFSLFIVGFFIMQEENSHMLLDSDQWGLYYHTEAGEKVEASRVVYMNNEK